MVISNKERLPGPGIIVSGKFTARSGLKAPGILFYNEKGDESGGLIYVSTEENGKYAAGAALALDKYRGDQVIGLSYNDDNGNRIVGFNIWDQPAASQRVFVGRSNDRSANVTLIDANSRPRLRLVVGPDGDARIEFLDAAGKVTHTFPAPAGSSNK